MERGKILTEAMSPFIYLYLRLVCVVFFNSKNVSAYVGLLSNSTQCGE